MKHSDHAQNKAEELKGRAKEAVGAATDDDQLRNEGRADQGEATVKEKVSEAADKLKEGVDTVKEKLTGR